MASSLHRKLFRSLLAVTLCAIASQAFAQARLFAPGGPATGTHANAIAGTQAARQTIALDAAAMHAMAPGDAAIVTTPGGIDYAVIHDRTETGYAGGKVWVGHLRDIAGNRLVIISTYDGHVSGSIDIPGSKLRLEGAEQQAQLTDLDAAGETAFQATLDDIARPPPDPLAHVTAQLALPGAAVPATAAANSQIDLLLLYSPNLNTNLGGSSAVIARANALVTTANTIYSASAMSVTLNLVGVQLLNTSYADAAQDCDALGTGGTNCVQPPSALTQDANVAALRNQYGADLVTLMRPFTGSICGLAWITGNPSTGVSSADSPNGYSVFENGSSGGFYCADSTMTHELGHNMGANHDVGTTIANTPTASYDGSPSYNRGYCNGSAGTVMAYTNTSGCNPDAVTHDYKYFSNPNLTTQCGGSACGWDKNLGYTAYGTSTTTTSGADSVTAINANAVAIAAWRPTAVTATKFVPLAPARILDTRAGFTTVDGQFAGGGALSPSTPLNLTVVGRGGVPSQSVGSVVLTVTATSPTAASFITAWPAGTTRPVASNLNVVAGQTISNTVIAKVGSNGNVSLFNSAGSTDLIADVAGWFPTSSGFTALPPARLLDTRIGQTTVDGQFAGAGTSPNGHETDLTVVNRGGVPASGVSAVVLNVTVAGAGGAGYITAWPAGAAQPNVSNLNYPASTILPNLVVAGVSASGKVALYNSIATDIIADVAGWFSTSSELTLIGPARLLDTRSGQTTVDGLFAGGGGLGAGGQLDLTVDGRAGIPASGVGAVVLNVTAITAASAGYLTVWPSGTTRPNASNVNFAPHQIISNLVFAKVGSNGKVSIYNNAGANDIIADVVGWLPVSP